MAVGFRGRILQYIKALKRGVTVPTVKASLHAGENVNAEVYSPSGDDSPPLPDDMGFFTQDESTGGVVNVGAIDQVNAPEAEPGEKRFYARDSAGNIVAVVWLKADGTIELNGTADNAVRFLALDTALQLLVAAVNAALATKLDGAGTAGAVALDISGAKVDEVELP